MCDSENSPHHSSFTVPSDGRAIPRRWGPVSGRESTACTVDTSRQRKSYFLPVDDRIRCLADEITEART